jgi:hypothetical protein
LQQRLKEFEADNQSNAFPIQAVFRMDAGFGTRENVAWLIEMGYEVYTKPYSDWLTPRLKLETQPQTKWMPVGANAEMIAWKNRRFADFPYALDVGLERFYTGSTQRFGTLIHFGADPVTTDLPTWFQRHHARQIDEAGMKEGQNVEAPSRACKAPTAGGCSIACRDTRLCPLGRRPAALPSSNPPRGSPPAPPGSRCRSVRGGIRRCGCLLGSFPARSPGPG